ncbi:hypothetical protein MED193_09895 [Roseobacter sp. MED193]|nr:hypothetical protein MED193_09895 [Roseobacter sp. MED193]
MAQADPGFVPASSPAPEYTTTVRLGAGAARAQRAAGPNSQAASWMQPVLAGAPPLAAVLR